MKYKQLLRKSSKRTRSTKNLPKTNESQSLLDLMTTGVTTRLQRKSRNISRSTHASSSAAVSGAESSQTPTSTRSSAPLPTVTVTVNINISQNQENVKEEIDPLCTRSMSETVAPSPASNSNLSSATRRGSSNGNNSLQQNAEVQNTTNPTAATNNSNSSTTASFHPTKIKTDPDGDVVMKTESDSNSWSTYPPNGLKHEVVKVEDTKTGGKTVEESNVKKDETNVKDEKKIDIKKEPIDDKEIGGTLNIFFFGFWHLKIKKTF